MACAIMVVMRIGGVGPLNPPFVVWMVSYIRLNVTLVYSTSNGSDDMHTNLKDHILSSLGSVGLQKKTVYTHSEIPAPAPPGDCRNFFSEPTMIIFTFCFHTLAN